MREPDELDTMAVDAMMTLIQGVYGELRNPTQLRAHVTALLTATAKLGTDDPGDWDEAVATFQAYLGFLESTM